MSGDGRLPRWGTPPVAHTCRGCDRFTYTAECMHCGEHLVPDTAAELIEQWLEEDWG